MRPAFPTDRPAPARNASVVVRRAIAVPGETGLSLFERVATDPYACLLESLGEGGTPCGPAVIGLAPLAVLRADGRRLTLQADGREESREGDPIEAVRALLAAYAPDDAPELPRYPGALGYFGYDTVRQIERLPELAAADLPMPEACWIVPGLVAMLDPDTGRLDLVGLARVQTGESRAAARVRVEAAIERLAERLSAPAPLPASAPATAGEPPDFVPQMPAADFCERVETLQAHILAGDIFQAVLSQRFETLTPASPLAIYRELRQVNPSPHMYLLQLPEASIVGASPELLVRVRDGELGVRPIAGTRPRGQTPEADRAHADALGADPKELAEHVMLVDLGRNDVGRVATLGSVKVREQMVIERYSHVMHLVSSVTGDLPADKDAFDALRATFPAGTLSGAPKVRAMSLIEACEPVRRGLYGGGVGYFGFNGDAELAIAIRTLVAFGDRKVFQTGAGVVHDSVPASEYQETLDKARALRVAITRAHLGHAAARLDPR